MRRSLHKKPPIDDGSKPTAQVRRFFEQNPDEELTFEDFRNKFGLSDTTARDLVKRLIQLRELEFAHVIRLRSKGIAKAVSASLPADYAPPPTPTPATFDAFLRSQLVK